MDDDFELMQYPNVTRLKCSFLVQITMISKGRKRKICAGN